MAGAVRPRVGAADDGGAPHQPVPAGIVAQPVRELVILDQAVRIERAHGQQRQAAVAAKRAGDQQQPVHLHPGVAGQEIADVLVALKPLQQAARSGRCADRGQHARGGDQGRVCRERRAHGVQGCGFQQGVGVDGQHQFGGALGAGDIERLGLAAMWQPQPAQRRVEGAGWAYLAQRGHRKAVPIHQHGSGVVARAVIGDQDRLGGAGLGQQGSERGRQHGGFVVRGDDDGRRWQGGGRSSVSSSEGGDWTQQRERLPEHEGQQHRVVQDVDQPGGPREQPAAAECACEQHHPQQQGRAMDRPAPPRGGRRREARRECGPPARKLLFDPGNGHR